MIKFLREESDSVAITEKLESGYKVSISFMVPVISSALQLRLADLARLMYNDEGKQKYISLQFKTCIENNTIRINEDDIEADKLADMADYTHKDTRDIIALISSEIDKHCTTSEEDEKKSEPLPRRGKIAKAAKPAR